jgi:hypothetical protein
MSLTMAKIVLSGNGFVIFYSGLNLRLTQVRNDEKIYIGRLLMMTVKLTIFEVNWLLPPYRFIIRLSVRN